MKRYIIVILFLFFEITLYSQNRYSVSERTNITSSAVDSLEKAINTLIKKDKELCNMKGLRQLHIFWLPSIRCDIPKEEYLNKEFLHKLIPEYYEGYVRANYIIYDTNGKYHADGSMYALDPPYLFKYKSAKNEHLIDLSLNDEVDFIVQIDLFRSEYICVKDSNIFVAKLVRKPDGRYSLYKDYNWEEYMESLYEKEIKYCNESKKYQLEY